MHGYAHWSLQSDEVWLDCQPHSLNEIQSAPICNESAFWEYITTHFAYKISLSPVRLKNIGRQGKKRYIVCFEWDHVYLYFYFCRFSVFSIHWINRHVFVVARIGCLRTAAAKTNVETLQWMKMIVQEEERQNKKQMYRLHLFILFKLNVKRSESIRENDDDDDDDGRCNSMCVFAQCT